VADTQYHCLPAEDRRYALRVAQEKSGLRAYLLEKDIWVVATLAVLFGTPFADHLVFKGGTSLSKAWQAIRRFSEDVDITYDIRAFAPDLVSGTGDEALPPTRSQQKRWTQSIRARLAEWVQECAKPAVEEGLASAGFLATVRVGKDRLRVGYEPLFEDTKFVVPEVLLEFGARSTGEPHKVRRVVCDAADCLPELAFPEAHPSAMLAERTFWEKATAIHVFCRQQRSRGERQSRHWFDLAHLEEAGVATNAMADREIALSVARHKAMFFLENDAQGDRIDYAAAVSGSLQLVPSGTALTLLEDDYSNMQAGGMLLDEHIPFLALMDRCSAIEEQANTIAT